MCQIELVDFAHYYDVLMNGSQKEKSKIAFQLIDNQNKGFFRINDLAEMIRSLFSSWAALTGYSVSKPKWPCRQAL